MDNSGESIPFALLIDIFLDLCDGSTIKSVVGVLSESYIAVLTHIINCSIALRAGGLRFSSFFPLVPR